MLLCIVIATHSARIKRLGGIDSSSEAKIHHLTREKAESRAFFHCHDGHDDIIYARESGTFGSTVVRASSSPGSSSDDLRGSPSSCFFRLSRTSQRRREQSPRFRASASHLRSMPLRMPRRGFSIQAPSSNTNPCSRI